MGGDCRALPQGVIDTGYVCLRYAAAQPFLDRRLAGSIAT
jgi:hypothetical protein